MILTLFSYTPAADLKHVRLFCTFEHAYMHQFPSACCLPFDAVGRFDDDIADTNIHITQFIYVADACKTNNNKWKVKQLSNGSGKDSLTRLRAM